MAASTPISGQDSDMQRPATECNTAKGSVAGSGSLMRFAAPGGRRHSARGLLLTLKSGMPRVLSACPFSRPAGTNSFPLQIVHQHELEHTGISRAREALADAEFDSVAGAAVVEHAKQRLRLR